MVKKKKTFLKNYILFICNTLSSVVDTRTQLLKLNDIQCVGKNNGIFFPITNTFWGFRIFLN